jgi:anti-sigma B factor antagonist
LTVFVLETSRHGARSVVRLAGRLDLVSASELRSTLDYALDDRPSRIVVDLGEVEFVDSTGLGVLVAAQRRALGAGSSIVLSAAPPIVETVLRVTSAIDLFPLYASPEQALAAE